MIFAYIKQGDRHDPLVYRHDPLVYRHDPPLFTDTILLFTDTCFLSKIQNKQHELHFCCFLTFKIKSP